MAMVPTLAAIVILQTNKNALKLYNLAHLAYLIHHNIRITAESFSTANQDKKYPQTLQNRS